MLFGGWSRIGGNAVTFLPQRELQLSLGFSPLATGAHSPPMK
jgi:hypothetical protein